MTTVTATQNQLVKSLTIPPRLRLTSKNYYSRVTDQVYMSATWFKKFEECEASALYELGEPPEELRSANAPKTEGVTPAMLVGNHIHSYFESGKSHQEFVEEHTPVRGDSKDGPTIYTQKGKLLSKYSYVDLMVKRMERFDLFNYFYNAPECQKEAIISGQLFGVNWKGKIDSLNVEKGYFCDLKTTAEIDRDFYNPAIRDRELWFDHWNYGLQMAAYKKLLQNQYHKPFHVFIFAVDKKTPEPAIESFEVDYGRIEKGLKEIEEYQPLLMDVIAGKTKPIRCGKCNYCRATYQPTGFKSLDIGN
ncbi:PD-(D/E)XK nuclease-like domain-containing protein [Levilactobacillus brevis]|nr:PD-(D/E)XK nuclease-like domain-containing protein [Levilactobacillus brevis]